MCGSPAATRPFAAPPVPPHTKVPSRRTAEQSWIRQENIRILVNSIRAAQSSDDQDKLMPAAVTRHVVKSHSNYLSLLTAWRSCGCHTCTSRLNEIIHACEKWLGVQAADEDEEYARMYAYEYVSHAIHISESDERAKLVLRLVAAARIC